MANITKIYIEPIGEFVIKFSIRSKLFEVDFPPNQKLIETISVLLNEKNIKLESYEDVEFYLDAIKRAYHSKVILTRKVIVIQLESSEADYESDGIFDKTKKEKHDLINSNIGFNLKWYVAEEYKYSDKVLKYKIIETFKGDKTIGYMNKIDIAPQLFFSGGNPRIITYREDLHHWLRDNLNIKISNMLKEMNKYFDMDPDKFIQNFESINLKFLK